MASLKDTPPPGVGKPHDDSGLGPKPDMVFPLPDDSGLGGEKPVVPPTPPAQPEEPVPDVPPMEEEGMSWWVILLIVLAVLLLIGAGYALAARQFNLKWHEIITNF